MWTNKFWWKFVASCMMVSNFKASSAKPACRADVAVRKRLENILNFVGKMGQTNHNVPFLCNLSGCYNMGTGRSIFRNATWLANGVKNRCNWTIKIVTKVVPKIRRYGYSYSKICATVSLMTSDLENEVPSSKIFAYPAYDRWKWWAAQEPDLQRILRFILSLS